MKTVNSRLAVSALTERGVSGLKVGNLNVDSSLYLALWGEPVLGLIQFFGYMDSSEVVCDQRC